MVKPSVDRGPSTQMSFQLHERLAADCFEVTDLAICKVLLMNDARYPWLILVPQREALTDLHQIAHSEQAQVFAEITRVSHALEQLTSPYKLNVAALGNQVPQLHIHVIARNKDDEAWPGPVWGVGTARNYKQSESAAFLTQLKTVLS